MRVGEVLPICASLQKRRLRKGPPFSCLGAGAAGLPIGHTGLSTAGTNGCPVRCGLMACRRYRAVVRTLSNSSGRPKPDQSSRRAVFASQSGQQMIAPACSARRQSRYLPSVFPGTFGETWIYLVDAILTQLRAVSACELVEIRGVRGFHAKGLMTTMVFRFGKACPGPVVCIASHPMGHGTRKRTKVQLVLASTRFEMSVWLPEEPKQTSK